MYQKEIVKAMYQGAGIKDDDPYMQCEEREKCLHVVDAPCWKCEKIMKVAMLSCKVDQFLYGPEYFSEKDMQIARDNGVIIKNIFSKTIEDSYNANVCEHCGSFIGSFYLFQEYFVYKDKLPSKTIKYIDL